MGERGQGRYDRSRYGSGSDKDGSFGRYHDRFFEDMRMGEPEPERSFSSRLHGDGKDAGKSAGKAVPQRVQRTRFLPEDEVETELDFAIGAEAASVTEPLSGSAIDFIADDESDSRFVLGAAERSAAENPAALSPSDADAALDMLDGDGSGDSDSAGELAEPVRPRRDFSRKAVERELAVAAPQAKKKRGVRRALVGVGVAAAVVVLVGAGVALAYFTGIVGNLNAGIDADLRAALVETDMANEPFYMLLLGTDGSAERDGDSEFGGVYRSDSMMLARIDPVAKKATLISIGRDIMVDLGGEYGEEKINAAYAFGGAALAVKTVSALAGVPISHYAQIDFDGFSAMVDALGGVDVDVPITFVDGDAAGSLHAGYQTLNGEQALALCRTRNAYADVAAHPDEMRAANQRLVLSAIAKKLLASDVATIAATVQAMSAYVTTDLALGDIIGLAQIMQGLDSDTDIYTASVPTTSDYVDGGWYEFVNKNEWNAMMKRIEAGEPPVEEAIVDEATGTVLATAGAGTSSSADKQAIVTVKNATSTSGLATQVRSKLVDAGFVNVVVGEITDDFDYPETLVVYDAPGRAREAGEIVNVIGQGRAMQNDGSYLLMETDFIVVIGGDWHD